MYGILNRMYVYKWTAYADVLGSSMKIINSFAVIYMFLHLVLRGIFHLYVLFLYWEMLITIPNVSTCRVDAQIAPVTYWPFIIRWSILPSEERASSRIMTNCQNAEITISYENGSYIIYGQFSSIPACTSVQTDQDLQHWPQHWPPEGHYFIWLGSLPSNLTVSICSLTWSYTVRMPSGPL